MNLPLPKETRDHFGSDKNHLLKISNLGLLFNKYFYCWPQNWQTNEEQNKVFRKDIEGITSKINLPKDSDYVEALNSRQRAVRESLQSSGWHVESFNAETDSRLIIGLGGTSVIETGMTLHPLYGFPYLPGSGLKGLARAYAEIAEVASKEELHVIFGSDDKNPRLGSENIQGRVFFMDGLPITFPKLDLDIMNPHYSDYYSGKKDSKDKPIPPADYLNPIPVTFLAVAAGQPFSFAVFSRDKELAEKATQWLIGGLTELGAGGKTNVGYGYFKIVEQQQVVEDKMIKEQPAKTGNLQMDNSLKTRLKSVKNQETFTSFIKQLKTEDIESLNQISFSDMKSVINIGLAPTLELLDIPQEIKQIIAKKILEVCSKPDEKHKEKLEKYKRLLIMAGSDT